MATVALRRSPPGPPAWPVLGHFPLLWRKGTLNLFLEMFQTYGEVVRLTFLGLPLFLVSHPDYVKHVLQENHTNYRKSRAYEKFKILLGEGLLTSEGETWLRDRRLMQPMFHRQRIAQFASIMTELTAAMLERWDRHTANGQPLDVSKEMMRLTLAIVSKTMFSADVSGDADAVGQAMVIGQEHTNRRVNALIDLPPWLPTPRNIRASRARAVMNRVVWRIIRERRERVGAKGDLLDLLLEARDAETGSGLSDRQVRDEVMTIFLAGHETTANALTWTWYLLSRHPEVARRLQGELGAVLGGRSPTIEDIPQLRYTTMVIEESMRLYPPAWAISRQAIGEDEIGGYGIPAKSLVAMSTFVTHRHPAFWENPEAFDPDRFAPERAKQRPRFAYFPFGGGPRQCIGNNFAMLEAQLVLAMVAQRHRLDLVPGHPVVPEAWVTLRPRYGLQMTLQRV
jgi:cytochrome P450